MEDTMKLALRISAIDLFSGVLRRFRSEIVGTGKEADKMQRQYDSMLSHVTKGMKALAAANYGAHLLEPAVGHAATFQDTMYRTLAILQGQYNTASKLNDVYQQLANNAKNVGVHTIFGAEGVAQFQLQLVQAGVPVQAIVDRTVNGKLVHGAAYQGEAFAEANGLLPETAGEDLAKEMHAFRIPFKDYGKGIDAVERAINLGSGNATEYFHNMEQVDAIANLGNTSIRDASVALKAIAPLGEQGGSDLGAAMSYAFGGSMRGTKALQRYGLNFYNKQGQFIGLFPMLDKINAYIASHHFTEQQRNMLLERGFQRQGFKALSLLLEKDTPGAKSLGSMNKQYDKMPSLAQVVAMRERGLEFSAHEMQASVHATEITLFTPLLDGLTKATKLANGWAAAINNVAQTHKSVSKIVSYGSAGIVGTLGLVAAVQAVRAGKVGLPLFKNLWKGGKGIAGGVAEGKVLEQIAGVTPVFVTNWPAGGIGGGLPSTVAKDAEGAAVKDAEAAAGGGLFARIVARLAPRALGSAFAGLGGGGAAGALIASVGVTGAAAGGYLFGHEVSEHFIQNNMHRRDMMGGMLTTILAELGNKSAQAALDRHFNDLAGPMVTTIRKMGSKPAKLDGTVRIQIDQAGRAKVTSVRTNQPDVHLDVGYLGMVP